MQRPGILPDASTKDVRADLKDTAMQLQCPAIQAIRGILPYELSPGLTGLPSLAVR
jgi:hypothetical protein